MFNQPRSLSKFYSWQEKRDATWAGKIEEHSDPVAAALQGEEDRPYYSADL